MKPTLHLIGIFHTLPTQQYSHCAFTGKAMRFPKMMMAQGYNVIEYSNYGSEANASEHVTMLTADEFDRLYGNRDNRSFHGDNATIGTEGHRLFESRLIPSLHDRVKPRDIICHPFGHAHSTLLSEFPSNTHVETGIGYPTTLVGTKKIFESYAWMHYHQGKEGRNGENYEWVIPNYFDTSEWEPSFESGDYLAFLGRITPLKGLDTIKALADYSPWKIRLAGQGDPTPWEHPNIEYVGPLKGKERSTFLRNARACLMPTIFTEPFGGSGVEGMLCGTPLVSVDYGAFTETVIEGVTGFRCHTLQDWVNALQSAGSLDRKRIYEISAAKYSLDACGKKYARIFSDLDSLWDKGWYTLSV
jgi:glycosyltransferase involved in cell wall biosynthesis